MCVQMYRHCNSMYKCKYILEWWLKTDTTPLESWRKKKKKKIMRHCFIFLSGRQITIMTSKLAEIWIFDESLVLFIAWITVYSRPREVCFLLCKNWLDFLCLRTALLAMKYKSKTSQYVCQIVQSQFVFADDTSGGGAFPLWRRSRFPEPQMVITIPDC